VRVLAAVGTQAKAERLRKLGCERLIVYREHDFVAAVKDNVGAVDVVLDIVGGSYVPRNLSILAPGGRHVSLSFMEGAAVSVDLGVVMSKSLMLTSSTLRPKTSDEKARLKRAIEHHAWPLVAAGHVCAVVHADVPLAEAAEAHRILEASEHVGKVVLTCR
jgi:NADPH2:quinone reductase